MARTTPTVRDGYLEWQAGEARERVAVGTPAWFAWLEQHTTFAYVTPSGGVTVRRDRGQRGGWYWRAYVRRHGRLRRSYLGTSETLTPARLQAAAEVLLSAGGAEQHRPAPYTDAEPSAPLAGGSSHVAEPLAPLRDRPFLAARLQPPRTGRQLLERPALMGRISEAARRRLTLLVAPAAFGKTTVLAQWCREARQRGRPVAWLTLEQGDNEPARFWQALLAALQLAYPGFGERAMRSLPHPAGPIDGAVVALLNDLASIPHDLTIVLDDYQFIDESGVHAALASFITRLPPQIHLVVAGRTQPPWALGRMRAARELTEIRAVELCLGVDEAALLLRERLQLALSAEQVTELVRLTEGWIGGLQLAAEALRKSSRALGAPPLVSGDHEQLVAFFVEEVLQGLPEPTQTFLCESAILDRLSGPLCVAVTGEPASATLLAELAQNQLFLSPLDAEGCWYRYHPLFSSFLREQLARRTPERRVALYRAAVHWFVQAGLLEEAIAHGLEGGLIEETADLLERHGDEWLLRGELRTLRGWLDALPEPLVRGRPRLLLLQLCALMLDARWDCVEPLLTGLGAWESKGDQAEWSIVAGLTALIGGQLAVAEAVLDQARGSIPEDDRFLRAMLAMLDGAALWVQGEQAQAKALLAALPMPRLVGSGAHLALLAIAHQAHFDAVGGRLETAILRYRQVCEQSHPHTTGATAALGMALLGLAQLHYERNELAEALEAVDQLSEQAKHWGNLALLAPTGLVRAQILLARGDLSAAAAVVEQLEQGVRAAPASAPALVCLALARAELALARDEAAVAASWLGGVAEELQRFPPGSQRERAQRLAVRVQLERGDASAALASLQPLIQAAQERSRVANLVPLLALAACAYEALGQRRQASEAMLQSLQHGAAGPFVQSVVAAGPLLRPVLANLPPCRREETAYAGRIRAALAQQQLWLTRAREHEPELLSPREQDVLRLLADGATNREIAAQLLVTESTVKKYLGTIYEKLGVARRTQAILAAQARGLASQRSP